jgi:N-acetylmuramoyl-L-alanine amidase
MRVASNERVRRRLLREAVADNLDTIRGLPPRALRRKERWSRVWLRRAPLVLLVPITLVASTYFSSAPQDAAPAPVMRLVRASVAAPGLSRRTAAPPSTVEEPLQRVAVDALPLSVRRVVLDAGHGGKDAGAVSYGVVEKDVTLDIGTRLRTLLEQNGYSVVTTRSSDTTIPLRQRADFANSSRSDIFVSIHVNTIEKHTNSHGVETYYLGATNDPKLTKLAAAENSGSGYTMADLRKLLEGIYADARRDESRQLATQVQKQLFDRLRSHGSGLENWGVKRAPFVVLVATDMPAILAEVGCISNQKDAALLARPDYRQKIAEALFEGIRAYAGSNEGPEKKGT